MGGYVTSKVHAADVAVSGQLGSRWPHYDIEIVAGRDFSATLASVYISSLKHLEDHERKIRDQHEPERA